MRDIELFPTAKGARGESWVLRLGEDKVVLFDADDQKVLTFPTRDADQRFKLPSFWESVKELGVVKGDGTELWFRPEAKAVAAVRDFLDWSLAAQGPEALQALRLKGWLMLLGGVALVVVGVVAVILVETVFGAGRDLARGGRKLVIMPFLFGFIALYFGIKALRRCARAGRIL
jgi:hypothetical protein